jgi:magnesium-protoporphyrin O-methyltransferase
VAKTTRELIDALLTAGVNEMTLLDIGGGLGAIQHELLAAGARQATHVEASSAYLDAARKESQWRNIEEQISFMYGDFVSLAPEIPVVDIVTLDRVVCCYDNMPALINLSAARAGKLYGMVFPRDRWLFRLLLPIVNFFIRLTKSPFRIYIHQTDDVDRIVRNQGLELQFHRRSFFWQIVVYARQ